MTNKYYIEAPDECDFCKNAFGGLMYDAVTSSNSRANMCHNCFVKYTRGVLGAGLGQQYTKQEDGRWLKTGG